MSGQGDGATAKRRRFSGVSDVAGALTEDKCAQSTHRPQAVAPQNSAQRLRPKAQQVAPYPPAQKPAHMFQDPYATTVQLTSLEKLARGGYSYAVPIPLPKTSSCRSSSNSSSDAGSFCDVDYRADLKWSVGRGGFGAVFKLKCVGHHEYAPLHLAFKVQEVPNDSLDTVLLEVEQMEQLLPAEHTVLLYSWCTERKGCSKTVLGIWLEYCSQGTSSSFCDTLVNHAEKQAKMKALREQQQQQDKQQQVQPTVELVKTPGHEDHHQQRQLPAPAPLLPFVPLLDPSKPPSPATIAKMYNADRHRRMVLVVPERLEVLEDLLQDQMVHIFKVLAGMSTGEMSKTGSRRFWHGDIKPANILVDSGARFKLGDWGLARSASLTHTTVIEPMGGTTRWVEAVTKCHCDIGFFFSKRDEYDMCGLHP